MTIRQRISTMCRDIEQYTYYVMRIGREKKVKNLANYVRRKVNEKFKDENAAIIKDYLKMKGCGKLCSMIQKNPPIYAFECGKKRKSGLTSYCKNCPQNVQSKSINKANNSAQSRVSGGNNGLGGTI